MRFRTKLYISFVVIALLSTLLGLSIVYFEMRKQVLRDLGTQVLSVSASAAILMEGKDLSSIRTPEDTSSPEFQAIKGQLQKIRKANQRTDIYVRYLYIVRPSEAYPGNLEIVVDASQEAQNVSLPGDLFTNESLDHVLEHLEEYYAPRDFTVDKWGHWFSAYAPIYDSEHNYVATVGADLYASIVIADLNQLLYDGVIALFASLIFALLFAYFLSRTITYALQTICHGLQEVGKGNFDYKLSMHTEDEFQEVGNAINAMCRELKEKERIKRSFSHYVSEYVLQKILQSDVQLRLEGEKKKVTVLFSDLRQFTHLAELYPPEQIVGLLNEYFERMLEVIFKNNGTLDKFLGDGIMAEFGSPLEDSQQAKHAVQTACEMQMALTELCEKWERENRPTVKMGIGIHTGVAIVGNIGTLKRMEYTAIGDTVNVASRIERESKKLGYPVLVSDAVWQEVKDAFEGKNLGEFTLPGREEKITLYAIVGTKS